MESFNFLQNIIFCFMGKKKNKNNKAKIKINNSTLKNQSKSNFAKINEIKAELVFCFFILINF